MDMNKLTVKDLENVTDSQLDHMIDCAHDCDSIGNEWGQALLVEERRRKALRVLYNATADVCVAALGDRGAQGPDLFALVMGETGGVL
jgi:hypothetical protein